MTYLIMLSWILLEDTKPLLARARHTVLACEGVTFFAIDFFSMCLSTLSLLSPHARINH